MIRGVVALAAVLSSVAVAASRSLPRGPYTAKGAAVDLARAFIDEDSKLFREVCMRARSEGNSWRKYAAFLDDMTGQMAEPERFEGDDAQERAISFFTEYD